MSRTFELGCDLCNVSLWIGQRGTALPRWSLYTTKEHGRALEDFLMAHAEHPLRFFDSERKPDDWREIGEDDQQCQSSLRL